MLVGKFVEFSAKLVLDEKAVLGMPIILGIFTIITGLFIIIIFLTIVLSIYSLVNWYIFARGLQAVPKDSIFRLLASEISEDSVIQDCNAIKLREQSYSEIGSISSEV